MVTNPLVDTAELELASSLEAVREAHWLAELAVVTMVILFLIALYLTIRFLATSSNNLQTSPPHIQNAIQILKWIAVASILLAVFGYCVDTYSYLLELGIRGEFGFDHFASVFGEILIFAALGSALSLFALVGIALVSFKSNRCRPKAED